MNQVPIYISVSDIEKMCEAGGEDIGNYGLPELFEFLHQIGFDLTHLGYAVCEHMPKHRNTPITCGMLHAVERQDREWLNNPMCSFENIIQAQDDVDHKVDLRVMSRYYNTDDMIKQMKEA